MAKYQYRVAGELAWQSNSGNALLVISNPNGSGKKLTLRSFEATPLTSTTVTGVTTAAATQLSLARATVEGGVSLTPTPFDTDAGAWPSSVQVLKRAAVTSPDAVPIRRINCLKQLNQASLSWMGKLTAVGRLRGSFIEARKEAVEAIMVNDGESIAVYAGTFNQSFPVRVSATLKTIGTPNHCYSLSYVTTAISRNEAIFAIQNTAGSGISVCLREISIEELGTYDSPYFQLVPVGSVVEADNASAPSVLKMDTDYPSPSSWMSIRENVSILPFGMPENALADSSAGSPKGFNYLKTKDFLGPVYKTIFPEYVAHRVGTLPDAFAAWGHKGSDIGVRHAGITIREGEGIALVSGAETAAGATAAVGVSGWSTFDFGVIIDVEPKLSPTLTLTGLKNPSEVRVFSAGTTTAVAGQETITDGTFTWVFDPEENPEVDIAILSLGYQNIRLTELALSLADISIPIQQQIDRQYSN